MQGKASTHGSPMGKTESELTKAALGLNPEIQFQISNEALTQKERSAERAKILRNEFISEVDREFIRVISNV